MTEQEVMEVIVAYAEEPEESQELLRRPAVRSKALEVSRSAWLLKPKYQVVAEDEDVEMGVERPELARIRYMSTHDSIMDQ